MKSYSELIQLPTFIDRFKYLQIKQFVGEETFGYDRYLNQVFYKSKEWEQIRKQVILRDLGCDLAFPDYEIHGRILVHHINPITLRDINNRSDSILDPENLIIVSHQTHNAIHYGDETLLSTGPVTRTANDTCPWR